MQNPSGPPDLAEAIEEERALDRAFQRHAANLATRQSGVCWSGPPVAPCLDRSPDEIEAAARARLRRQQAWLARDTTTWLQAMIDIQTSARDLNGMAERGRETWSRGLSGELEGAEQLVGQIRDQIPALKQALDRAHGALEALRTPPQTR